MSEPYRRLRASYKDISGNRFIATTDSSVITLATGTTNDTIFVQKIHIEVTTSNAQTWTFQDSAGSPVPIVPSVSTASVAHFDFDFGPNGVPCTVGTNFNVSISGAGAAGWIAWEGYSKRTTVAAA